MSDAPDLTPRRYSSLRQRTVRTHLLSNGSYSVMLTAAGSGYSRWREFAITRWREDPTRDHWGSYVFIRDVANGTVWSAGYQPTGRDADAYEVSFFEDRAEFMRRDGSLITTSVILVAPTADLEVRRISIANTGESPRELELTTYCEVVLTTPDADSAHPAFAKMFVQTEFVNESNTLLAMRRPREPMETSLWAAHFFVFEGESHGDLQFETDRARFLGRGNELPNADSVMDARPLSNTAGTVLDPVLALRRRVRIAPGETVCLDVWTVVASDRERVLALADLNRDAAAFERVSNASRVYARACLDDLGIDVDTAHQFQRLAGHVLYADASLRAPQETLDKNQAGPAVLWSFGVSGDIPIVVVRVIDTDIAIVKTLLRAHEYWRLKRLAVDLIIVNELPASSAAAVQTELDTAIDAAQLRSAKVAGAASTVPGKVFALRANALPAAGTAALYIAARVILTAGHGRLEDQLPDEIDSSEQTSLAQTYAQEPARAVLAAAVQAGAVHTDAARPLPALEFFNGIGGFAAGGNEYVTILESGRKTPAPWINVIANPNFGFQVSTDGSGCTWSQNARENQITPWSNDPVSDPPSEAIYIRDEVSGESWSATPSPVRGPALLYRVHHGFGYSRFEHTSHGISLDLLQFVPLVDTVKISRLKILNVSTSVRRLSVTHYVDWVLGNQRSKTAPFIVTELEPVTQALLARNPWRMEFQTRVAFIDMRGQQHSCSGDRAEFLGRHGSLANPAAMSTGSALSNRVGGGHDSCGAQQTTLTLQPGEERELVLLLGEESNRAAAIESIMRYRTLDVGEVLKSVTDFWDETLGVIQVKTPDRSIDILLNGWLLYQCLVCRVWGRTGFYQTSGAYGYRDQLQDVMALCVSRPELARQHILRASARQFEAGDVQHWWLPTSGQGIQTRVADDRIWLAFVLAHYLEVTRDDLILQEELPFLAGPALNADQHEIFTAPAATPNVATLFEHCVRALDSSLKIGSHRLPLFGTGDWNDGMNRVGAGGQGESVWMGWFLYATLLRFAPVAENNGAAAKASLWRKHAVAIQQAIEREAWDGDWYRRGYYDDGTPLGSALSDECRIDAIAQSWAVISGAAPQERATQAMAAVDAQLVSRGDGLVKLFAPPFDRSSHDPGYIKAYPPGLRENGGQYTHAAMWTTLAFALLGDGDRAVALFSLLNPINHSSTRASIDRYKVEPYVVCADVYSAPSHVGRGGWTWYTGSAGWMYRTAVEGILGITLKGTTLCIDPCIPHSWSGFEVTYKRGAAQYQIVVDNPLGVCRGVVRAVVDERDITAQPCELKLIDDGAYHYARITLG